MTRSAITVAALLTTTWPHSIQQTAAVDLQTCRAAQHFDLNHGALAAVCRETTPTDAGFQPGWDTIKGYNR